MGEASFDHFRRQDYDILPSREVISMTEEYILLFNTITDVLETLEQLRNELIHAQQQAEELYISRP